MAGSVFDASLRPTPLTTYFKTSVTRKKLQTERMRQCYTSKLLMPATECWNQIQPEAPLAAKQLPV
jgi:hypothetical protein